MDFLRLVDTRYFGLTPGQYGAFALLGLGILMWRWRPGGLTEPGAFSGKD